MNMGGGFGAKYGIYDALTAVLAIVLKQPVRLVLTRSEDFQSTTPSANSKIYLKTGALKNGYITALQAKIEIDNGIFAMPFSGIMASLIGGYYKCKNTCNNNINGRTNIQNKYKFIFKKIQTYRSLLYFSSIFVIVS